MLLLRAETTQLPHGSAARRRLTLQSPKDVEGDAPARSPLSLRLGPWRWVLPWSLVTALSLLVVAPFFTAPPLSHDHPVHLFKAWHFWTEMLGRGRLQGWSPYWGFGYPSGELTPFGPEAWVAGFRVATLGLFSWIRTYGIALAGVLVFSTLGTFAFTRRQFGTAAGVIAAVLTLIDPGEWAEGGWMWHTTYGVWPVTLAMGFVLFALTRLSDVMSRHRSRDIVVAGALICASLVVHQLPLIVYPIAVPLLALDRRLRAGSLAASALGRLLLACSLGVGLAAFYLIPMLARSDLTQDLGVLGISREVLGQQIANGGLFAGMWPPFFALGVLGAILALGASGRIRLFVPLCTLVFVLLSSHILIANLHLENLISGLTKIEARRALLVAKLLWFSLVAHAVVTVVRVTFRHPPRSSLFRNQVVACLLLAVVAAPIAWPALVQFYRTQVAKSVQGPSETLLGGDLASLLDWSARMQASTSEHYRMAYALPMHDHLATIAPVFDRSMIYKVGYTPAQQFNRFPMSDDPSLLEALSVKYVVSDHPLAGPDFTLDRAFGALQVYRFNRYRAEPFTLIGAGQAQLLTFEPETIRIRVRGTDRASRLKLHVASFPRWRALLDGGEVPISTVTVHDAEYPILMEVPVHDGELEFRYVRRGADWLGLGVTCLTLLGLAGALAARRIRQIAALSRWLQTSAQRWLATISAWLHAKPRRPAAVAAAVAAVLLVLMAAKWTVAKPPLSANSLFTRGSSVELQLAGTACRPTGFASFQCGDTGVKAAVRSCLYGAHVCMFAPSGGPLVVTAPMVVPRFVTGRYDTVGGTGQIRLQVGDHEVGRFATRDTSQGLQFFRFDTRTDAGKFLTLRITLEGAPLHCFDLSVVR